MTERLFQPNKQHQHCPQCGSPLQIRRGGKGLFLGCSAYPDCDYLKPLHPNYESKIIKRLEQQCPECGHYLVLKQGHFGMFIGCGNHPACHFIVHEEATAEERPVPCPECKRGELVARRGRQGKYFYACNRFPQCRFTLPGKPYAVPCPICAYPVGMLKNPAKSDRTLVCANKHCRHVFEYDPEPGVETEV